MKNLSICALLVCLNACGAKKSSNKPDPQNEQAYCACMAQTNYQLTSPQAFPEKMKITLNSDGIENMVLLDECSTEQFPTSDYKIQRSESSGIVEGKFYAAVRGNLEVEIIDMTILKKRSRFSVRIRPNHGYKTSSSSSRLFGLFG